MTSDNRGGPRKGRPDTTTNQAASYTEAPIVRDGLYTRPLPLCARDLGPECWWLRSQPWADDHLARLASAWKQVYGRAA